MDADTLTARDRKLIRRVVKAMRAEFDIELRKAVEAERDTVLYGLKSLARLNGSGEAVMRFAAGDVEHILKAATANEAVTPQDVFEVAAEMAAEMGQFE